MTLDEWNDQRLNSLAHQVDAMAPAIGVIASHDVRIERAQSDVYQLRESQREALAAQATAQREALAAMSIALEKVGERCEEHTQSVKAKIDAQSPKFGPAQRAVVIAAGIAANGAVIAALIGVLNR